MKIVSTTFITIVIALITGCSKVGVRDQVGTALPVEAILNAPRQYDGKEQVVSFKFCPVAGEVPTAYMTVPENLPYVEANGRTALDVNFRGAWLRLGLKNQECVEATAVAEFQSWHDMATTGAVSEVGILKIRSETVVLETNE